MGDFLCIVKNVGSCWMKPYKTINAYVGGDAYNYIINGNYATAYFVLAVGLALICMGFLIVYYISRENK